MWSFFFKVYLFPQFTISRPTRVKIIRPEHPPLAQIINNDCRTPNSTLGPKIQLAFEDMADLRGLIISIIGS